MMFLWLSMAFAGQPSRSHDFWVQLNEGRLIHILEGNPSDSLEIYSALLENLPRNDPLFGEIMYWTGYARYDLGDHEGARKSMLLAFEDPRIRQASLSFLQEMGAVQRKVTALPCTELPYVNRKGEPSTGKGRFFFAVLENGASDLSEMEIHRKGKDPLEVKIVLTDWLGRKWVLRESWTSQVFRKNVSQFPLYQKGAKNPFRSIEISTDKPVELVSGTLR